MLLDRPVRLTLKLGIGSSFSILYLQLSSNKLKSKLCTFIVKIKAIRYKTKRISLQCCDALQGMKGNWDVIFLDPPYRFDIHPYLKKALRTASWIVIAETASTSPPNLLTIEDEMLEKDWKIWKQKHYGASMVTIFQRNTSA